MTSPDRDIESQQEVLIRSCNSTQDRWRIIFLILRARQVLISSYVKAKRGSITSSSVNNAGSEEEDPVLPKSTQLSCDDSMVSNIKSQHACIEEIVKTKDMDSLRRFGGVHGIAEALMGIRGHEEDLRSRRFINIHPIAQAPARGLFQLLLKSCNNCIIFLLFVSAAMSTGFGIKEKGPKTGWYEGAIIILGISILVIVPTIRDYWHENFKKLPEEQKPCEKKQQVVDVLRRGVLEKKRISDLLIGDIVHLRWGSKVPGDGLFISGDSLKLDDGLATISKENPFLYQGSKVVNGDGYMLVTSVGTNTLLWNEILRATEAPRKTPLQAQIHKVSFITQIIGLSISILIPVVVFLHYKLGKEKHDTEIPEMKGKSIFLKDIMDDIRKARGKVSSLTTLLTMLVVGIVEGVPFIVSLAILHWNKRAMSNKAFAQDSLACVNMSSVTTICTDEFGGLALNQQEVSMCLIGEEVITEDSVIDAYVLEALYHGICTDFLIQQSPSNSTEDSILSWATLRLGMEIEPLKQSCAIVNLEELISGKEGIVFLEKKRESRKYLHLKGPARTVLAKCSLYYDINGREEIMNEEKRTIFGQIIEEMSSKHLETIAFAYKQVDGPPVEENNLILIGMLGMDISQTTRESIEAIRNAGVNVILFSEGDALVLTDTGDGCGLPRNSGVLVIEGEEFRNCSDEERMEKVDKMRVIRNCLPSDKLKLVQCLKQKGHIVAVVGYRANETPALKAANVGVAMGTWSSELARESSDIIILDGNFSSLKAILLCGRCTYNNIQKYIQLEVTMIVAALLITAITIIAFGDCPITAIQLNWANLVVAVLGGLALLTEEPTEELMEKSPIRKTDSFITKAMWRNIITQALFQAVMLVTFQIKSKSLLRINDEVSETMIFNSFLLCQVFNHFNAREPKMKNVFKGIHKNMWFWVAVSVTVLVQVVFIEIAHIWASDAKLNGEQWGICFLMGILSLPVDFISKCASSFIPIYDCSPHSSEVGSMGYL